MMCRDSKSELFTPESAPITTRPGLPLLAYLCVLSLGRYSFMQIVEAITLKRTFKLYIIDTLNI